MEFVTHEISKKLKEKGFLSDMAMASLATSNGYQRLFHSIGGGLTPMETFAYHRDIIADLKI